MVHHYITIPQRFTLKQHSYKILWTLDSIYDTTDQEEQCVLRLRQDQTLVKLRCCSTSKSLSGLGHIQQAHTCRGPLCSNRRELCGHCHHHLAIVTDRLKFNLKQNEVNSQIRSSNDLQIKECQSDEKSNPK